ncbi:MAG: hypothetical protein ACK4ZW_06025 [Blastomonas sp.]
MVEQTDRDAAAAYLEDRFPEDRTLPPIIREAKADRAKTVQAFAAHRQAAEARILARLREPDAAMHYAMKEALAKAYRDGATDVHNAWEADEHSREPDFGEAASDYGSALATAALAAAADAMENDDAG